MGGEKNKRRKPVQGRAKVTVDAILQATAQILLTEGADRLSTNRIAKRAGVSVGSLYQYFSSKEAIVAALAEQHIQHERDVVLATLATLSLQEAQPDVPRIVRGIIKGFFEAHQHEPQLHRVLLKVMPEDALSEGKRTLAQAVGAFLASRSDRFRPGIDPELTAFILIEMLDGAVQSATLHRADLLADDRLVDALTDAVLRILLP